MENIVIDLGLKVSGYTRTLFVVCMWYNNNIIFTQVQKTDVDVIIRFYEKVEKKEYHEYKEILKQRNTQKYVHLYLTYIHGNKVNASSYRYYNIKVIKKACDEHIITVRLCIPMSHDCMDKITMTRI